MLTYISVFLGTFLIAAISTPFVIKLAWNVKAVDKPGVRKVHKDTIPRIGGVIFGVSIVTVSLVFLLDNRIGDEFRDNYQQIIVLFAGAIAILAVGVLDDVFTLRARYKLSAQIAIAYLVCAAGIRIETIGLHKLFTLHLGMWSVPFTLFWIVGMTNIVNLIDGLDGLAAGISAIACGTITLFALYTGHVIMIVVMLALLGALLGFLLYNFNPAKLFMGDGGAYFLGFMLGTSSIISATKSHTLLGLALPFIAMGIPIFDTFFAMIRRIIERRPLFAPDRGHIHHRLVDMGLHQKQAVIILYLLTLVMVTLGSLMLFADDIRMLGVLVGLMILLVVSFKVCGVVKFKGALSEIKNNIALNRQKRRELETFHNAELLLRDAKTPDQWWEGLCRAAEELDFAGLQLTLQNGHAPEKKLIWPHPPQTNGSNLTHISVPIRANGSNPSMQLEADLKENGSLEGMGRRIMLFSRLLTNYGMMKG